MSLEATVVVHQGDFTLDAALTAAAGDVVAILGPNGSGKTTLLRAIAGTVALDGGRIAIGSTTVDDAGRAWVPPADRGIGLVPQDLLLFGHLDALDNVAFGLRARGVDRRTARAQAQGWLERFGLATLGAARARSLSGGQAQRVALARALAVEPTVLLLDEPLAALDPSTRQATRRDLRSWLGGFAGTTLVVTHDPLDALTLADHVVVLEAGQVTQAGPLAEVTAHPRTEYVAGLLGTNLLVGVADGHRLEVTGGVQVELADRAEGPVFATIAPRAITVHVAEPEGSARNRWPATIDAIDLLGDRARLHCTGPIPLIAEVTPAAVAALGLAAGVAVWLAVKATEVTTYDR